MTTTRDLAVQATKTGPWIIGYVVSLGAAFAAAATGTVTEMREAMWFWVPILGCTGMIIYTSWKRHRLLGTLSEAVRQFWRRMVASAGFMFAGYCFLAYAQATGDWSKQAQLVLWAIPSLGFAGMIWCAHQYVADEQDEYLRSQSARQLIIASFVTLIVSLASATIAPFTGLEGPSLGHVVLIWFGGMGVGRLVNELRP